MNFFSLSQTRSQEKESKAYMLFVGFWESASGLHLMNRCDQTWLNMINFPKTPRWSAAFPRIIQPNADLAHHRCLRCLPLPPNRERVGCGLIYPLLITAVEHPPCWYRSENLWCIRSFQTHRIHVWNIYLHLAVHLPLNWNEMSWLIFHTWSIWKMISKIMLDY